MNSSRKPLIRNYLALGIALLFAGVGFARAATYDGTFGSAFTVSSGSRLTSSGWNALTNNVLSLFERSETLSGAIYSSTGILANITSLSGNYTTLNTSFNTLSGIVLNSSTGIVQKINVLSGAIYSSTGILSNITNLSNSFTTLSGAIYSSTGIYNTLYSSTGLVTLLNTTTTGSFIKNGGQSGSILIGSDDINQVNLETNNVVRMTLDSNGNIGVGTSTPADTLHVNGSLRLQIPGVSTGRVLVSNSVGTATWQDLQVEPFTQIELFGGPDDLPAQTSSTSNVLVTTLATPFTEVSCPAGKTKSFRLQYRYTDSLTAGNGVVSLGTGATTLPAVNFGNTKVKTFLSSEFTSTVTTDLSLSLRVTSGPGYIRLVSLNLLQYCK